MWEQITQLEPFIVGDNNKSIKDNDKINKNKVI